jgi:two-component system, OmpR family, response regulator
MNGFPTAVVLENDAHTGRVIGSLLQECGFTTVTASSGARGVDVVERNSPLLVTVDLSLPDIDGLEVLRRIRTFSDAYVLVVTASRDERDLELAFGAGADDYLCKPFHPRIFQARVHAVQRRPRRDELGLLSYARPPLRRGGLVLDPWAHTVQVEGKHVSLTHTEFEILRVLMESGRRPRSNAELALLLRARPGDCGKLVSDLEERTIPVHICNLRRKLGAPIRSVHWLETVHGEGYRLAAAF